MHEWWADAAGAAFQSERPSLDQRTPWRHPIGESIAVPLHGASACSLHHAMFSNILAYMGKCPLGDVVFASHGKDSSFPAGGLRFLHAVQGLMQPRLYAAGKCIYTDCLSRRCCE